MKLFGLSTKKLAIIFVLLIAFILRVVWLDRYPVGFTPDEASFGYDAYSLIKTGKDQWGESFPLTFRSFGDSKLPLYAYLTIPSVAIFGLNEFATRLPSALFGVLAVLATYLMTKELFKDERIAFLSSLLLAISPWHLPLSRGAFEANLTGFFMPFGVWAFLKGIKDKRFMVISALSFGLNMFTYHSARMVAPLLVFGLSYWKRKDLGYTKLSKVGGVFKNYWLSIFVFSFFFLFSLYALFASGTARASDILITNPTDNWMGVFDRRYDAVFEGLAYPTARFFSNKATYLFDTFVTAYSTYLSPQYLFTQGPAEWTYGMIPGRGVLYLVEIPFVLTALYLLVKRGIKKEEALSFVLFWILVAPIPAALTKGPGSAANRAAVMLPAIQVFSAFGGVYLFKELAKKFNKKVALGIFTFLVAFALAFFLEDYVYHTPRNASSGMLYGRKEAVEFVEKMEDGYEEIVVSRSLSEPQIFVAFYQRYDPASYQEATQDWLRFEEEGLPFVDQLGEYRLGKYTFRKINFNEDRKLGGALLVGKDIEFPDDINFLKTIYYPSQEPAVLIYDPALESYAYKAY